MMMMMMIAQKKLSRGLFLEILLSPQSFPFSKIANDLPSSSFYHPRYQRHSMDGRRCHHWGGITWDIPDIGGPFFFGEEAPRETRDETGGFWGVSNGQAPNPCQQVGDPKLLTVGAAKEKMGGKWDERWNIWWVYFLFLETKSCLHAVSFLIVRLSHLLFGNGFRVGALGCSFRNFGLEPCFLLAKVASLVSQTSKNLWDPEQDGPQKAPWRAEELSPKVTFFFKGWSVLKVGTTPPRTNIAVQNYAFPKGNFVGAIG